MSARSHHGWVTDQRLAASVRLLRRRRAWRQRDLAAAAGVSQSTVSRMERGHIEVHSVAELRRVLGALDARLDVMPRWRGGDLERILNESHNRLHEAVARKFAAYPEWVLRAEVSYAHFGERGSIDVVGWHPRARAGLVIELKADLVDPGGLVGQVDRYCRLLPVAVRDLGWQPVIASAWVVVAESRSNRHRFAAHRAMLRGSFPVDGRSIGAWLAAPDRPIRALSFLTAAGEGRTRAKTRMTRPLT